MKFSELTYKVVASFEDPNYFKDEYVDWANEMVLLGYDTPSILILAGLDKPRNYFEVIDCAKKSLQELGIKTKTGDDATISYCSYFIRRISRGENVKENLRAVYQYCKQKDYETLVYDFYLLWWAWDDFDYGNLYESSMNRLVSLGLT